jgi:hypothetical protein
MPSDQVVAGDNVVGCHGSAHAWGRPGEGVAACGRAVGQGGDDDNDEHLRVPRYRQQWHTHAKLPYALPRSL